MATVAGVVCENPVKVGSGFAGKSGTKTFSPDPATPGMVDHYRVRAWNLTRVEYEFWNSTPTLSLIPPSGNPILPPTVLRKWQE